MILNKETRCLKPHPMNNEIYNDSCDDDLLNSIKTKGILNPILITKNDVIISGHRRYYSAIKLKLDTVPIIESDLIDELDIQEAIIENNKQRIKTKEQQGREYQYLKRIESERAKARQGTRNDLYNIRENFPESYNSEKNKTSNIAATKLGISGKTAEKIDKVINTIDKMKEEGNIKQAEELSNTLNNKSVESAFKIVKEELKKDNIETEIKSNNFTTTKQDNIFISLQNNPDYKSTFNYTNDSIEWAKWTWNPVSGCLHICKWCYARTMANNDYYGSGFPNKFAPTFYPKKLTAPKNTRIPEVKRDEIGITNVFVCSMADLFGDWLPNDIIKQVLNVCIEQNQWNYLFLTKNPKKYLELDMSFPKNLWIGASANNKENFNKAYDVFSQLQDKTHIRFLSCEPLEEDLELVDLKSFNWIIIGGLKDSENTDRQPKWEWIESILNIARRDNCQIYFKPNLTVRPKEYPIIEVNNAK